MRVIEFSFIPPLLQNPKLLVFDDPEAVGDLASEGFPLVRDGLPEEPQDRIRELLLCWVMAIVCHALVHDGP